MKNNYLLLLLSFTILTLSCCKRDDDQPPLQHTLLLPQEVKDYLLFKPGTYWVYQNSKTQELDSIYVYETVNETKRYEGDGKIVDFESLQVNTYSSYENYNINYQLETPVLEALEFYNPRIKRVKTKPGDYVGETIVLFHPYNIGDKRYPLSSNGHVELINILKNYNLNDSNYTDVLVYKNIKDASENLKDVNYYFAKNVGLIKREIKSDNLSWDLLRYHIKK